MKKLAFHALSYDKTRNSMKRIAPARSKPLQTVAAPVPMLAAGIPVRGVVLEIRGKCGVCATHRAWPIGLPGTAKRFFCMTCERNTLHQKIS